MIELRSFLNQDSPGIAALWSEQPLLRGRIEKLTPEILEQYVLAKPYFDPRGLVVAEESGRTVGFVHIGFEPGLRVGELEREKGIVCLLMVAARADADGIADRLLGVGEAVLLDGGAKELLGGGSGVHAPYYLGLYGGCRLPGVLAGDAVMNQAFRRAGYSEYCEATIWHRPLTSFRPPVDRQWMQLRRQYRLQPLTGEPVRGWSDVCAYGWIDPLQFGIDSIAKGSRAATLTFWNMEPLAGNWGQRAMGLAAAEWDAAELREKLLGCFLAEAMRHFQTEGVGLMEVQCQAADSILAAACQKLGFSLVDRGMQYRKTPESTRVPLQAK
jgi:hypothetical protein